MFKVQKRMLKEGDVVECANGSFYRYSRIVGFENRLRLLNNSGWLDINDYDENLNVCIDLSDYLKQSFKIINIWRPLFNQTYISEKTSRLYPYIIFRHPLYKYICLSERSFNFINLQYYV